MKKMRFSRYLVLVLISCFLVSCNTSRDATKTGDSAEINALLWKIEGAEINTSYLFGTIHLIDKDEYFFTSDMQKAFDESETLALEFNIETAMDMGAQMGLLQKAFMRNDTTLSDLVTEDEYKIVQDHFKEMGLPFFLFERVKPMFLTIFASEDMFSGGGMTDIKSYELELAEMAKSRTIPIEGLETMEYQMSIFDSIPYRAQAEMLVSSIEADETEVETMDTMVYYYKQQNLRKLDELINSDPTTVTYRSVLLDNRNRNWIPVIEKLMVSQPTFIAVGAGHLSGSAGVIRLLRDAGYKLTPINSAESGPD